MVPVHLRLYFDQSNLSRSLKQQILWRWLNNSQTQTKTLVDHGGPNYKRAMTSITTKDSICGTAVEQMPHYREIVGSIPAGYWAFFSSYPQ